jgi:hypothetical protein
MESFTMKRNSSKGSSGRELRLKKKKKKNW